MPIKNIYARQIFDSIGDPTVEVDIITDLGLFRAAVPSGVTKGRDQSLELRDGLKRHYFGRSVNKAVANVNDVIGPQLIEQKFEVTQQCEIDEFLTQLDGTENKSSLGVNAILGVSLAVCKAGAAKRGLPLYKHIASLAGNTEFILPVPAFNVLNGGNNAGNPLAIQEFTILPTGAKNFQEAMKMGCEIYKHLKAAILKKFGKLAGTVADAGGFAPKITDAKKALTMIKAAIKKAGYTGKVNIGIDCAANDFFKKGKYDLNFKKKKSPPKKWIKAAKLTKMYMQYIKKFPVVSIEDPFGQNDWKSWTDFTKKTDIQVVGDDLTLSNVERIKMAVEKEACNSMILMLNQAGTVTESIKAYQSAKEAGWGTMICNRPGETEDTFIADFVVGLSTGQIKTGAPCRSERLAKYNQILRIEEELGEKGRYAGESFRNP